MEKCERNLKQSTKVTAMLLILLQLLQGDFEMIHRVKFHLLLDHYCTKKLKTILQFIMIWYHYIDTNLV